MKPAQAGEGELGPDSGPGWRAGGNAWRTGFRGGGPRGRGRAGTGRNAPGPDHSAKPGGLDRLTCPKGQVRPGFRSRRPEGPSSSAGPALSMKPASPGQSAMGRARAARGLAGWEGQVAAGCPQAARRFMGPLVAARAATSIPLLRRREGLSARSCEGIVGGAARRVARAVSEPERSASRRPSGLFASLAHGGEGGGHTSGSSQLSLQGLPQPNIGYIGVWLCLCASPSDALDRQACPGPK